MTLRKGAPHARERWLVLAATVLALGALVAGIALASLPASFFIVTDEQGANDVPGQVDLTQMGRDDTDPDTYKLLWSWDSIDQWTGTGQTGDACALFDSDGDGNINAVVCGQITNPGADPTVVAQTSSSPFVFKCSDKKNDRCTNPSPVTYTSTQVQAGQITTLAHDGNLITDTDPFDSSAVNGPGTSWPKDSTIQVNVLKSFLTSTAGGAPTLVNVCSYPSAGNGGNNNPFDCIVTPGGGFLKIVKNVSGGTTQTFLFTLTPAPASPQSSTYTLAPTAAKSGTDSAGPITIPITTSQTVTETIPSGWSLLSSSSCTIEGVSGTTGTVNTSTGAITGIAINSGKLTTCTFNDAPIQPKLTLAKTVVNDNGGTAVAKDFTLSATGSSGSFSATAGTSDSSLTGDTGKHTVVGGVQYTLGETGPDGYSAGSWDCTGTGGTQDGNKITITYGGDVTCSITNDDVAPQLTVIKHVINDNGGTASASDFTMSVTATNPSDDSFAGAESPGTTITLDAGSYSVAESGPSGYSESDSADCSGTIAVGESKTCTITNDDESGTLIVKKLVINDNGGTKIATDFTFQVNGAAAITFLQDTDTLHGKNTLSVNAGTYSVTEPAVSGYSTSYSNCTNVSVANGGTQTCTITNDDQKASPGIGTTMKWTLNDRVTLSDFRTGGTGGTATFYLYKGDNTCSVAGDLVFSETVNVDNATGTAHTTSGFTTEDSGTYYWFVTYSGNNYNEANDGTGTCGDEVTTLP